MRDVTRRDARGKPQGKREASIPVCAAGAGGVKKPGAIAEGAVEGRHVRKGMRGSVPGEENKEEEKRWS